MISVCVPYWQRQAALDKMFKGYTHHYSDLDLEFSVCDDGSPEPAIVPRACTLTRLPTKKRALNPCVSFNRAVAASTGEVIVLTTPEIEHREPILYEMLELLQEERDYVAAACRDTRGPWIAGPKTQYGKRGKLPVPPGAHFHFLTMLHRSLWDRAGGYDEDYRNGQACDDNDWLWRLAAVGARFHTTQGHVIHHPSGVRWRLPHNRNLFFKKWPEARRCAVLEAYGSR
jgi:hypothetical protein